MSSNNIRKTPKSERRKKIKAILTIIFGVLLPIVISINGSQILDRWSENNPDYVPFTYPDRWLSSHDPQNQFKLYQNSYYKSFLASNQSYLVCQVSEIDFCELEIIGPKETKVYPLNFGENTIPLMFEEEKWEKYTIKIGEESIQHIDFVSVQPFFLVTEPVEIEYSTDGVISEQDLYYVDLTVIGPVSILIKPDLFLNQFYIKVDNEIIQNLHPWSEDPDDPNGTPMMPAPYFSLEKDGGPWISYDVHFKYDPLKTLEGNFKHRIGIAADCSQLISIVPEEEKAKIDCMSIIDSDWDMDGLNDKDELNRYWRQTWGPFIPDVWGYYSLPPERDTNEIYSDDNPWAQAILNFYYPGPSAKIYADISLGEIRNITIDGLEIKNGQHLHSSITDFDWTELETTNSYDLNYIIQPGLRKVTYLYNSTDAPTQKTFSLPLFLLHLLPLGFFGAIFKLLFNN